MQRRSHSLADFVRLALDEDIGRGDLTSLACLEPGPIKAQIVAKGKGLLSGITPAAISFQLVDSANNIKPARKDGESFSSGDLIIEIDGFNQSVLTAERTALNFLSHLSGIATLTGAYVKALEGTNCRLLDTRKTIPGLRLLEKMAVVHGGGVNHRKGLYEMILIKDNHIASAGSVDAAIERVNSYLDSVDFRLQFETARSEIEIEVEVTNESELRQAINSGANRLLLDNLSVDSLEQLVDLARELNPKVQLEASGNITSEQLTKVASTGVDFISVGALTHSAPASDFSLVVVD